MVLAMILALNVDSHEFKVGLLTNVMYSYKILRVNTIKIQNKYILLNYISKITFKFDKSYVFSRARLIFFMSSLGFI